MARPTVKTFKDLVVWQKAHELTLSIYKTTHNFPSEEKFGLTSQLRRSTSSIPANVVEGYKKNSRKEFLHFLNIAETSLEETKYHLLLSRDFGYLVDESYVSLLSICNDIGRMLASLQKSLHE